MKAGAPVDRVLRARTLRALTLFAEGKRVEPLFAPVLNEGSGEYFFGLVDAPPKRARLTGALWGRLWHMDVRPAPELQRAAGLLLLSSWSGREALGSKGVLRLARKLKVLSPRTDLHADARIHRAVPREAEDGKQMLGLVGSRKKARPGRAPSIATFREAALPHLRRCAAGASEIVEVETTGREIVSLTGASKRCVRDALWEAALAEGTALRARTRLRVTGGVLATLDGVEADTGEK